MPELMNGAAERALDRNANRLAWFLVGVVVGATAAVLYAPQRGKDAREYLVKKTQEGKHVVESTSHEVAERGRDLYVKGRQLVDDAADLYGRGRRLVKG